MSVCKYFWKNIPLTISWLYPKALYYRTNVMHVKSVVWFFNKVSFKITLTETIFFSSWIVGRTTNKKYLSLSSILLSSTYVNHSTILVVNVYLNMFGVWKLKFHLSEILNKSYRRNNTSKRNHTIPTWRSLITLASRTKQTPATIELSGTGSGAGEPT